MESYSEEADRIYAVSGAEGRILEILLVNFLRGNEDWDAVYSYYKNIFEEFGPEVHYRIVVKFPMNPPMPKAEQKKLLKDIWNSIHNLSCLPEDRFQIFNFNDYFCLEVQYVDDQLKLPAQTKGGPLPVVFRSNWAQDTCTVLTDEVSKARILTYPSEQHPYSQISLTPTCLTEPGSTYLRPSSFRFAGGNVISFESFLFVGKDTAVNNIPDFEKKTTEEQIVALRTFSESMAVLMSVKHVILIGEEALFLPKNLVNYSQGKYQPAFHLDLFITPGGRVGNKKKQLVFVGKLVVDGKTSEKEGNSLSKELETQIRESLDRTANWLAQYNKDGIRFKVVRIPLFLNREEGVFYPFNNCVVEVVSATEKTVYLPNFVYDPESPLLPIQQNAIAIFNAEGFQVKLVAGDWLNLSNHTGGSLHCMVKVLSRLKSES